jgi:hypothetical protein
MGSSNDLLTVECVWSSQDVWNLSSAYDNRKLSGTGLTVGMFKKFSPDAVDKWLGAVVSVDAIADRNYFQALPNCSFASTDDIRIC